MENQNLVSEVNGDDELKVSSVVSVSDANEKTVNDGNDDIADSDDKENEMLVDQIESDDDDELLETQKFLSTFPGGSSNDSEKTEKCDDEVIKGNDGKKENSDDDTKKSQKSELYQCLFCDESFESINALSDHLQSVHLIKKNINALLSLSESCFKKGTSDLSELIEEYGPKNVLSTENLSDIESDDEIDSFENDNEEEKHENGKAVDEHTTDISEDEKEKNDDEKEYPEKKTISIEAENEQIEEDNENNDEDKENNKESKDEDKDLDVKMEGTEADVSGKVDDPDSISLTIDKSDHFEDDMTEKKDGADDVDALSDLSLSGDEFENDNPDAEENVKIKSEKDEKDEPDIKPEMCNKCDVSHIVGEKRCSFLLKSSSDAGRKYVKHWERSDRDRERERPRVRTLPSELYHLPRRDSRERDRYRSRSPSPRPRPRRIAPPAPSPPGYEERRESRSRYDDEKRFRYDDHHSEAGYRTSSSSNYSHHNHTHHEASPFSSGSGQMNEYFKPLQTPLSMTGNNGAGSMGMVSNVGVGGMMSGVTNPMYQQTQISGHPGYSVASQSYQPQPSFQVTDQLPVNYTESLASLQPLQVFMSNKMASMPGQPYPKNYIDLLISNVGKMLAQANLGIRELENAFRHQGEEFLRGMLTKELQVYAERFPGGVNLPMIIQATIEYLVIDKYM